MSERNVEIVCTALGRFSAGDFDGTLELIAEDVSWEPSGRFVGADDDVYRGHEGVRRFWEEFTEPWEQIELAPIDAIALDGERVLTETLFRGEGRASGAPTEMRLFHIWTVREGKLTRYQSFPTEAEALQDAGRGGGSAAAS